MKVLLILGFVAVAMTGAEDPSTDVNDITFILWTPENPLAEDEQILEFGNVDSIIASNFDPSRPTKVLVHGYTDNGRTYWVNDMRDEFFKFGDFNIISVDYYPLGIGPNYPLATENADLVGNYAADFISFIVENVGGSLDDYHPIGFSLGAQVVGFIGHRLGGVLPRISGLDPAGFMFHTVGDDRKLSKLSAQYVDVIHSAGLWKGMDEPCGHTDYYPNKGVAPQPGCEGESISISCSHHRAPAFYKESINSNVGFEAVECTSWEDFQNGLCDGNQVAMMGYPSTPATPGYFYLNTNSESPYPIES